MKRYLSILLLLLLLCTLFTGCAPDDASADNSGGQEAEAAISAGDDTKAETPEQKEDSVDINEVADEPVPAADSGAGKQEESAAETIKADVDLTALSSTMIFAEMSNMMKNPNSYIGKTVRMKGLYYAFYYEDTDVYHHFIIVQDSAACCSQGMEFRLLGWQTYPDDYPEDYSFVEVNGVFGSYDVLDKTYYCVEAEEMT